MSTKNNKRDINTEKNECKPNGPEDWFVTIDDSRSANITKEEKRLSKEIFGD